MEVIRENQYFKAYRLNEHTTAIEGTAGELCYLLTGSEHALLIDGLCGVGSLKQFVEELTELPVTVALTHGHLDHIGAAYEYGECLIHPSDISMCYAPHQMSAEERYHFASAFGREEPRTDFTAEDMVPGCIMKTYPLLDGDVIRLGGLEIDVIGVPGHTWGTLVFLDRSTRLVFSGDACNVNTLLNLQGSASVEAYRDSLLYFREIQPDFDVMYGGHGLTAVPKHIIDEGLALCEAIITRTDDRVPVNSLYGEPSFLGKARLDGPGCVNADGTLCNIAYKESGIRDSRLFRDPNYPVEVVSGSPVE